MPVLQMFNCFEFVYHIVMVEEKRMVLVVLKGQFCGSTNVEHNVSTNFNRVRYMLF
jgi:hypothetical protein